VPRRNGQVEDRLLASAGGALPCAPDGDVRLLATIATFGTAVDATLSELAIEAFLPADADNVAILERPSDVSA
jgi:hypothetical protein